MFSHSMHSGQILFHLPKYVYTGMMIFGIIDLVIAVLSIEWQLQTGY